MSSISVNKSIYADAVLAPPKNNIMSSISVNKPTYVDTVLAPLKIIKLMFKCPDDIIYTIMSFLMNYDYKQTDKWIYYINRNFIKKLRAVMFYKFPSIYLVNVDGNVNNKICEIVTKKYNGKKILIATHRNTETNKVDSDNKPARQIKYSNCDEYLDIEVSSKRQNKLQKNKKRSSLNQIYNKKDKDKHRNIMHCKRNKLHRCRSIDILRERLYKNTLNNILYDQNGEFINNNDFYYDYYNDYYYYEDDYYDYENDYENDYHYDDSWSDTYSNYSYFSYSSWW